VIYISDYSRSVQILVEIAGNPEARIDEINKKLDGLSSKKVDASGPSQAASSMDKLSGSTDRVSSATSSLTSKMTSAFGNVKSSLTDLQGSIQTMATSLAGIAIGGTLSGLAWKQSAEAKLYNEQVKEAITNNRKLGISYEELDKFVKGQAEAGEGTKQDTVKEMYSVLTAGSKFFKGTGETKLSQADAITDFYFKHQEMMQEQGIGSAEQMVQRAIMTEGKMSGRFGTKFATAMGVSPDDASMKSAKARMKYFMEQGATVNMKVEMEKRPWEQLEVNVSKLKYAIGDSIAGPLVSLTNVIAVIVEKLSKIPGLPALIGLIGASLALASALSLVIGVLTPLYNVMKALNIITGIQTLLHTSNASATVVDAGAQAMLTGAMEGEFAVTELTTVAQNVSLATRLRLVGAKIWDTTVTYANSAANFLGISSLLGLASAEGVATIGAYGLATGIWAALTPLLPFIAAGALIVGVLALIANKFGILQPIINSFKKAISGDFAGAWKTLTDIKLPSIKWDFSASGIKGALSEIFSGTSFITTIIRLLGVPLYKLIDFAEQIRDLLKKVREFVEYLSGIFYKYVYAPLKAIWDWVEKLVSYLIGGEGKTGSALTEAVSTEISKRVEDYAFGANPGTSLRGLSPEQIDYLAKYATGDKSVTPEMSTALGITESMKEEVKKIADSLNKPKGVLTGGISPSGSADALASGIKTGLEEDTSERTKKTQENLDKGLSGTAAADWSVMTPFVTGAKSLYSGGKNLYNYITKNAIGGEVTKSGMAWVDNGEPIVPAEVARDSNLISLLEDLSSNTVTNKESSPTIIVQMEYNANNSSNNGRYLDDFAFERAVKNIIGKCIRTYGAY